MSVRSNRSKPASRRKLLAAAGCFTAAVALLRAVVHALAAADPEFPPGYNPHPTSIAVVGDQAITTDEYYQVLLWDLTAPLKPPVPFENHAKKAASVTIRGDRVFTAGYDGMVNVAPLKPPHKPARKFKEHHAGTNKPEVWAVAVSTDSTRAVSSTNDGQILVWKANDDPYNSNSVEKDLTPQVGGRIEEIGALAFLPNDRNRFISGHAHKRLYLWDLGDLGNITRTPFVLPPTIDEFPINCVAVTSTGNLAATAGFDKSVRFWSVGALRETTIQPDPSRAHTGWVWRVAFSPDDSKLASAGDDGKIKIWRVSDGAFLQEFNAGSNGSMGVAWWNNKVAYLGDGTTAPVQVSNVP